MTGMTGARERVRLTKGQSLLATAILTLALSVTPVFFIVMFETVNGLLGPYFDGWAWTVPVATEIVFFLLFLLAILFEWLRRPSLALWLAPYPFAAMSVYMNVLAAHGVRAAMAGHLAVTLAFFAPVMFAKAGVRRLLVTDEEMTREAALADATAHARDMLRSALGFWWHFRAPVLLRRQLRSGRLPAKVLEAVENGSRFGGATVWEPVAEAWIASAVTLPERTREALRAAREAVPAHAPETAPALAPGVPEVTPPAALEAAPRTRLAAAPRTPAKPALKLTAARSRGMTPDKLAEHVEAMLDAYGEGLSVSRVKTDLSVGTDKAKAALEIARSSRATVLQMGARKHA